MFLPVSWVRRCVYVTVCALFVFLDGVFIGVVVCVFTLLLPLLVCVCTVDLCGFGGGKGSAKGRHGSSLAGGSADSGATGPGDLRRRPREGMMFSLTATGLMLTATGLVCSLAATGLMFTATDSCFR